MPKAIGVMICLFMSLKNQGRQDLISRCLPYAETEKGNLANPSVT